MKSFAQEAAPSFTVPSGKEFPRAPAPRELFYLERDLDDVDENNHVINPWFARGAYMYDGLKWQRLTDGGRQITTSMIPSSVLEIERIGNPTADLATMSGKRLASQTIRTSHRKAKISGTASIWVDVSKSAHVWITVYRGKKPVGVVLEYVEADRPRTISLSFVDSPFELAQIQYVLMLNSDVLHSGKEPGLVYVNRSRNYHFEGMSRTAFTLSENT